MGWPGAGSQTAVRPSSQDPAARPGPSPVWSSCVLGLRSGLATREMDGRRLGPLSRVGWPPSTLALTRSCFCGVPLPGQIPRESDQVWRPGPRCRLPPGRVACTPRGGPACAAAASLEPVPAHTLVELECLKLFRERRVGSLLLLFDAHNARALVEALRGAPQTRRLAALPQSSAGLCSFFSPRSPPDLEEDLTPLESESRPLSACPGSTAGVQPWAPGHGGRGCALGPGLSSEDFGNGGCCGPLGPARVRIMQFGSCGQLRAPGGELPPRVQSASGQHLAGRARPLEAMALAPLPVAHPLQGRLVPFWVPKGAGNASSPLSKSTLEWEP